MLIRSLLKCKDRSPESNQLCSSEQENFQNGLTLDPLESVLNPLRAIKRNKG